MCICGSKEDFQECCGAIISHKRPAKTPEELMRSRYSAYVESDARYLLLSTAKEKQHPEDIGIIEDFSSQVEWLKLDIVASKANTVEFKAYYKDKEGIKLLHEKSTFIQEDGLWKYSDGELYNSKIERNESCPCGSAKKYKRCCAQSDFTNT